MKFLGENVVINKIIVHSNLGSKTDINQSQQPHTQAKRQKEC